MNIWFATNNAHKKEELEAILGLKLKIPADEGFNFDPEESGTTFHENALLKARELKKLLDRDAVVIADDSGLCVDALDGKPGIFSARYGRTEYGRTEYGRTEYGRTEYGRTGGKNLTSPQRNLLLLEELGEVKNRTARFVCAMVILFDNSRFFMAQETLEGEIVKNSGMIKGDGGFGYDPIFFIPELGRTLAELSAEEKNTLSHRGKAGKIIGERLCQKLT